MTPITNSRIFRFQYIKQCYLIRSSIRSLSSTTANSTSSSSASSSSSANDMYDDAVNHTSKADNIIEDLHNNRLSCNRFSSHYYNHHNGNGQQAKFINPQRDITKHSHRQQQQQTLHYSKFEIDPSYLKPAGVLVDSAVCVNKEDVNNNNNNYIPYVSLHESDGFKHKRVLVLCTGGTLTMAPDPEHGGSLAPVEGALTLHLQNMPELNNANMPDVFVHEYSPLLDSSDMGPAEWAIIADDIRQNYLHYDGFVVLYGTDTMAYAASALSFMLENLGKPVVLTGSQISLCEPYNDARRNIIMALIFASRDTINEVSIFFHDRLLRGARCTKVHTHRLLAFDSPNMDPLAKIGISIQENEHLLLPQAKGSLRVHTKLDTRTLTLRLVPGFDDGMIKAIVQAAAETHVRALVLQLYGTGNVPSIKRDFSDLLGDASDAGVLVVASTQCMVGHVMMGHYATGRALIEAGVVSANDMTVEAISCKLAYLFGRNDLSKDEVGDLMGVSLRGEITPAEALPPPPLSSAFQRASRKGRKFY